MHVLLAASGQDESINRVQVLRRHVLDLQTRLVIGERELPIVVWRRR